MMRPPWLASLIVAVAVLVLAGCPNPGTQVVPEGCSLLYDANGGSNPPSDGGGP